MTQDEIARKRNNAYVLAMYKSGHSLSCIPPSSTWFPPREIIKKNEDALDFGGLYSKKPKLKLVDEENDMADEKIGITETSEVVTAIVEIANLALKFAGGMNTLGVSGALGLIPVVSKVYTAILGSSEVPRELSDLSEEERKQLIQIVSDRISIAGLSHDGVIAAIDHSTRVVYDVVSFFGWIKTQKSFKIDNKEEV